MPRGLSSTNLKSFFTFGLRYAKLAAVTKGKSTEHPIQFPAAQRNPADELLADPGLDPLARLKDILRQVDRAHEEWVAAEAVCDDLPEGSDKLADAQVAVRGAFNRWHVFQEIARKAEDEVRRRSLEIPRTGEWQETYVALLESLKENYDGFGPHYDLLCEHLAGITVRLRMMEQSGRDVSSSEYTEIHKLSLGYVNQLQKYTEAMKSQTVNKLTQEVAEEIVRLFERHFGNLYPEQWKAAVRELREMSELEGAA